MPLNLNDLLKKAEKKGIVPKHTPASSSQVLRTWQQESVLYAPNDDKKLEPNLSQSEAKVRTELKSNLSQSEAKPESNISSKEKNLSQNKTKLESKVEPNLSQTQAKLESKLSRTQAKLEPKITFSSLIGLQRKIILFIHEICQTILEQQTSPLSIEFIATRCESPKSAVRKAIQRLEQKGILLRAAFKNGRGGWTQYQLPDQIYQEILMLKNQKLGPNLSQTWVNVEPNLSQSEAKVRTELEPQLRPNLSCSSSKDLKTTTTEVSEEWNFDITPYSQFGFTKTQVKQLATSGVISAVDVEQSLIEFSYDFNNNSLPLIKTTKINFLMGLLWKGQSYISEGFKNEQDAAIIEMAKREKEKKDRLLKAKFEVWESDISEEKRKDIEKELPTHLIVLHKTYGINNSEVRNWFFNYYLHMKK